MGEWLYTVEMVADRDTYRYFVTRARDGESEKLSLTFMDVKLMYPSVMNFNDALEMLYQMKKSLF